MGGTRAGLVSWGVFFIKLQSITVPTLKNFQSNGLSGETVKVCLDFYVIWPLHKKSRILIGFLKKLAQL